MKVSVVTSVYNGEPYFDRAIPSILGQTYRDFEWIILNDGSTDRTQELLEEVAARDQRVRILNFGRLGRARALNKAIEAAQGEYIIQQDFDDISYPERIEKQVRFLDEHPEVGLVGCHYVIVDEVRNERYVRMPPTKHNQIVRSMAKYIPFAHTLVAFRKTVWEEAGGYPQVPDIVDLRLWITFVKKGWKVANVPEILGEHFVHPESFWHRNFTYVHRQRTLARAQWQAIRELNLPLWMVIYPLGRLVYPYIPNKAKRFVRRVLGGSHESDYQ